MLGIENAVDEEGGCAIRCTTSEGSILLDTGLPQKLSPKNTDRLVFLSHSHRDHCGGMQQVFRANIPVMMSLGTARALHALQRVSAADLRDSCYFLDQNEQIELTSGLKARVFAVPHCPGSAGLMLSDGNTTLLFPGDAVFRTARHDAVPILRQQFALSPAPKRVCLIDATMARRELGAGSSNAAMETLTALEKWPEIIVVAADAEQLLYAYLDLYCTAKESSSKGSIEFALSSRLKDIFKILHGDHIARNLDQLDSFIAAQYGETMSSWGESRWLFWIGPNCKLSTLPELRRIWLVTEEELPVVQPIRKVGMIPVGRAKARSFTIPFPVERLSVDSSAWTLHSDDDALQTVVRDLDGIAETVLFHNFPKRLRKFADATGLNCKVLGQGAIPLI